MQWIGTNGPQYTDVGNVMNIFKKGLTTLEVCGL